MAEIIRRFSNFEEQYERFKSQFFENEEECSHEGTLYYDEEQVEERTSSITRTVTVEAPLLSTHDLFTNSGGIV